MKIPSPTIVGIIFAKADSGDYYIQLFPDGKICEIDPRDVGISYGDEALQRLLKFSEEKAALGPLYAAEQMQKLDVKKDLHERYEKLRSGYKEALVVVEMSDPARSCDVHKWQERFAPRYYGDFQTQQARSEYARNYIEALRGMKEGLIECHCKSPELLKDQKKAVRIALLIRAKMKEFREAHPDQEFPED